MLVDVRDLDIACDSMPENDALAVTIEYFDMISEIIKDTRGIMSEFFATAVQVIWNAPNRFASKRCTMPPCLIKSH